MQAKHILCVTKQSLKGWKVMMCLDIVANLSVHFVFLRKIEKKISHKYDILSVVISQVMFNADLQCKH